MKRLLKKFLLKFIFKIDNLKNNQYLSDLGGIGKNLEIKYPVCFEGKKNIFIGDDVSINAFVHIWGNGGVNIGNRVMIATHSIITSLTHDYTKINMRYESAISKPVIIEDDAWIGSGVVIMPGIKIGKASVIGAGSVVTKDIPAYSIAFGVPAKVVKYREINAKENPL